MANNIAPLFKNKNLTQKYLNTLYQLNAESKHPGFFCSFAMTKDKQKPKPRFRGDDGNYFSKNPIDFYNPGMLNIHNHNWFSLTTFRHYQPKDLADINKNIKRIQKSPNHASKNSQKNIRRQKYFRYLITSGVYPTRREDKYTANFLGNYIDVDCMQNGVNPKDLLKHLHKAFKQHKLLSPTSIQDSGHGLYMIYLYNKPFTLSQNPKEKRNQINAWKRTEQVLVRHFNVYTGHWFGKELGDTKSTNPARILRAPNTMNVKVSDNGVHFAHPYTSYILEYPNVKRSFSTLSNYLNRFAPQFSNAPGLGGLLQKRQKFTDKVQTKNTLSNFWGSVNTAVNHPGNPAYDKKPASKRINAETLRINHYRYGKFHPRRRSPYYRGNLHGFNQFNLVDYIKDHGQSLIHSNQNFVVTTVNNGKYSNDKNSIVITQKPNIYSKQYKLWKQGKASKDKVPTYSQLARASGLWDNIIGNYFKGNRHATPDGDNGTYKKSTVRLLRSEGYRKPDSITAWIMGTKHVPFKVAKKKRLKWFQKYAKKHTKTAYSWTDYGTADVGTPKSNIDYSKSSMRDILVQSYKDPVMKRYAEMINKKGYYTSGNLDSLNLVNQRLKKDINQTDKQEDLNLKKRLTRSINKSRRGQASVKRWINKKVINNNIARNYLIYRRCLEPKDVERLIKRRLVVGVNGYRYHPYVKDKNNHKIYVQPYLKDIHGNVQYDKKTHKPIVNKVADAVPLKSKKSVYHPPYVEFVQRVPRNAAESHSFTKPNYNLQDTWERDLYMTEHRHTRYQTDKRGKRVKNGRTVPKFIPKAGTQEEVPCGADFIYLRKTNQTYTDRNGRKHYILDKDVNVNNGGKGIDDNKYRLRNYGFNFRNGTGKKRLFIFEAPIDAISFNEMHQSAYQYDKNGRKHKKSAEQIKRDRAEVKDATFLSLGGSGAKVKKTVKNFIRHQFAYDNDFSHLISCTDNDYAGYQVPLTIVSKYGNINNYVKNHKPNQRLVTVEIPESNDRPKGQEVLRSQAGLPNKGQKGSFNKDWNAQLQSQVRYGKQFPSAGHRVNMVQFNHIISQQVMIDIGSADIIGGSYTHQPKSQSITKAKQDIGYADAYMNLASRIHRNWINGGNERINSTNPRTELMAKMQKNMSPDLTLRTKDGKTKVINGARHVLDIYKSYVGHYMNPSAVAKTMNKTYKSWFHEDNLLLKSKQFKSVMNKPYALPKIQQGINKTMNQMPDTRSKRLYATAIVSTANIWKRHIYHSIHDVSKNRYQYIRKYRNTIRSKHGRPIYKSFPENRAVYKAQNVIDNQIRRSCLGKLYRGYPKQYHQAVNVAPDIVKLGKNLEIHKYQHANSQVANQMMQNKQLSKTINNKSYRITSSDVLNGIDRAQYAKQYLANQDEYTYSPKQVLIKSQLPEYKQQVKIIDYNNKKSAKIARNHRKYNKIKYGKYNHNRKHTHYTNYFHRHHNTMRGNNYRSRNSYRNRPRPYQKVNKFMTHISPKNRKNVKSLISNLYQCITTGNRAYEQRAVNIFNTIKLNNPNDSKFIRSQHLSKMSSNKLQSLCGNRKELILARKKKAMQNRRENQR